MVSFMKLFSSSFHHWLGLEFVQSMKHFAICFSILCVCRCLEDVFEKILSLLPWPALSFLTLRLKKSTFAFLYLRLLSVFLQEKNDTSVFHLLPEIKVWKDNISNENNGEKSDVRFLIMLQTLSNAENIYHF